MGEYMNIKNSKGNRKRRRILFAVIVIIVSIGLWKEMRILAEVSCTSAEALPVPSYSEKDKAIKAIALSYFIYGCEQSEELSGTINELIENKKMGILIENFGIQRIIKSDPTSAVFDSSEFIKRFVGEFRFLSELKDESSSFYGAAFCDDANKCIWISYAGAISFKDAVECVELVIRPGVSPQEKRAFELFETVMKSDEVVNQAYSVILTGHSLGGGLASMVSRMSGCTAVTVNGVDGLAIDKVNGMEGEKMEDYPITNYMTSPNNGKLSIMDLVQRFMFLGSYKDVDYHVFEENGFTTDTHCAFSFIRFEENDFSKPEIPTELPGR